MSTIDKLQQMSHSYLYKKHKELTALVKCMLENAEDELFSIKQDCFAVTLDYAVLKEYTITIKGQVLNYKDTTHRDFWVEVKWHKSGIVAILGPYSPGAGTDYILDVVMDTLVPGWYQPPFEYQYPVQPQVERVEERPDTVLDFTKDVG